jgi:hypothetical protein
MNDLIDRMLQVALKKSGKPTADELLLILKRWVVIAEATEGIVPQGVYEIIKRAEGK